MTFLAEFWDFLRVRKKFWLLPMLLVLCIFGGLIILEQVSAVATFLYTMFLCAAEFSVSLHSITIARRPWSRTGASSRRRSRSDSRARGMMQASPRKPSNFVLP